MEKSTKLPSSGNADLDRLMEHDVLEPEVMVIDKAQFDAVLLPILTNQTGLGVDKNFEHLRNIWINYYRSSGLNNRAIISETNDGLKQSNLDGDAVYHAMSIVDENGVEVAKTPPLITPTMLLGITNMLGEYENEVKHNPNIANANLANSVDAYEIKNNNWEIFLKSYCPEIFDVTDNNINSSDTDDIDDGIIED